MMLSYYAGELIVRMQVCFDNFGRVGRSRCGV